jgi:hypothetical protein
MFLVIYDKIRKPIPKIWTKNMTFRNKKHSRIGENSGVACSIIRQRRWDFFHILHPDLEAGQREAPACSLTCTTQPRKGLKTREQTHRDFLKVWVSIEQGTLGMRGGGYKLQFSLCSDADPDPAFYFDADPDPTFHSDAEHPLFFCVVIGSGI